MTEKEELRFAKKVVLSDDCWQWTATKNSSGYASFYLNEEMVCAHRTAYEHFVGEIPLGFQIDHLCFNKACVNPDHLEAISPSQNTQRAHDAGRHPGNRGQNQWTKR